MVDNTYAQRLDEAMRDAGVSVTALAAALGVSYQAVRKVLNGQTKSLTARNNQAAADHLGVRAAWLATGDGQKHGREFLDPGLAGGLAVREPGNVARAYARNVVPLISWVQAGELNGVEDNYHPGDADEWVPAFHSRPGPHAFALRVVGDSMTSDAGGDSFPEGTTLIVDPDIAPDPGRYVIAKDVRTQKATFKRLMTDGGRWFLRPLNPAYETQEIDDPAMRVIGVVVECLIGRKV